MVDNNIKQAWYHLKDGVAYLAFFPELLVEVRGVVAQYVYAGSRVDDVYAGSRVDEFVQKYLEGMRATSLILANNGSYSLFELLGMGHDGTGLRMDLRPVDGKRTQRDLVKRVKEANVEANLIRYGFDVHSPVYR